MRIHDEMAYRKEGRCATANPRGSAELGRILERRER